MNYLFDSHFLISLYDPRDMSHEHAGRIFLNITENPQSTFLLPWPVFFETLKTRFVRRKDWVHSFERDIKNLRFKNQIEYIDDSKYRDLALQECYSEANRRRGEYRALSLVDRVIRLILLDFKVDFLLTKNTGDFFDICSRKNVQIFDDY